MRLTISILFLLLQLACLGQSQPASVTVLYQTDLAALRPERVGYGSNAVVRVLAGSPTQPWATGSRLWRSTFAQPAFATNTAHSVTIATNAAYPRAAWWISEDYASPIQDATWYGAPTNAWAMDASGNLVLGGTDIRAQLLSVITAAANALQRSNHLGTQPFATLTGLPTLLSDHGITNGAQLSEFKAHTNLAAGAHGMSTFGALLTTASNALVARAFLLLGTGATLDVAASGDAALTNLVKGDDSRMTNARPATAHTHPATNISDSGAFGRSLLAAAAKTNALDLLGSGRTGGSSLFLREDGSFATPPTGSPGTNGIPEAPNDSNAYVRKGLAWTGLSAADLAVSSQIVYDILTTAVELDDIRALLELVGAVASPIDSAAKYAVRTNSTGGGSVRHRLNLIRGTNVVISLVDDAFSDETDVTLSVTNIPWLNISGTPTNFAGYGISDAATDTELAAHAALTNAHGASPFGALFVTSTNDASARAKLQLGTGATLNVAASGDAAAGELMKGNDSRNTNARTPLAHPHDWSDITGEPTTLAGYGITDGATDSELAAHAAQTTGAHGMSTFGASLVSETTQALARSRLGLGTGATKDVPAVGNATTNQLVDGRDTRLSDARPPTAHTHAIADSTGLQVALDAKAGLAGTQTITGTNTFTAPLTATNGILTRAAAGTLAYFAGWETDPATGVARFVSANPTQVQGFLGWSTIGQLNANQTWTGNNTFTGSLLSPGAGVNSTKLGSASAGGASAVAVGNGASGGGTESVAIGASSGAGSLNAVAVGAFASASAQEASAIGPYSAASAFRSTALGDAASAGHAGSTAVGRDAATTAGNQVRLGTSSDTVSVPGSLNVSGGIDMPSGTPGDPGSGGRLYVYTNGGGKLVLAVKFPDGSSVNIATQP